MNNRNIKLIHHLLSTITIFCAITLLSSTAATARIQPDVAVDLLPLGLPSDPDFLEEQIYKLALIAILVIAQFNGWMKIGFF